jgi:hypothetical protein
MKTITICKGLNKNGNLSRRTSMAPHNPLFIVKGVKEEVN